MSGPLISILMPAYNARRTITAAILSVVGQTYRNWELLVVDDGSTDETAAELALFDDGRIVPIALERNSGLAHALNVGLARARGRFVARMDADDVMEDWRLAEQIRYLTMHGLAILGTGAQKFGVETGPMRGPRGAANIVNSFLAANPFIHPTVMLDRAEIGAALRYDADFRCEEDYELWSRIITADNCDNFDSLTVSYRTSASSNANHPTKKRLNRIVLERFADRFGIRSVVPIAALSAFQVGGFIDAPAHAALGDYAALAEARDLPRLGWLQKPLRKHRRYSEFMAWLNGVRSFMPYRC